MAVTLQQIADVAGVSRGTVDRALNHRGRIRPEVAERICAIAEELGYKPNAGGRALALLKKKRTIGVIQQFADTPFIIELDKGIREAQEEIERYGCVVEIQRIDGVDVDKAVGFMRDFRERGVSAIALVATDHERIRQEIHACRENGIPVVTFNSDLSGSERIAFFGQDAEKSGRTAAGIMEDILPDDGAVVVLSGLDNSTIQNERVRGFCDVLRHSKKHIRIADIRYTGETVSGMRRQMEELLAAVPDLAGIYMNAQGKDDLCQLLKDRGLDQKLRLIVNDLVACRREYIEDGTIDYVIDEESFVQGHEPIMTLFHLLYDGEMPKEETNFTEIKIISRHNIPKS